jgi:DNA modification methylase
LVGDAREILATLPAESVHCVVTSPPYWGLRDYGLPPTVWGGAEGCVHDWQDVGSRSMTHQDRLGDAIDPRNGRPAGGQVHGQPGGFSVAQGASCTRCEAWQGSLGLEPDPALYVAHLVEVFRAVRRVLRDDGTCWVNLGDSYSSIGWRPGGAIGVARGVPYVRGDYVVRRGSPSSNWRTAPYGGSGKCGDSATTRPTELGDDPYRLKVKDLVGIPWRVAFALQADGWWLRSEIIWHKPNPMPESVTDRPTKAHEQVFLLAKQERYYYDAEAIKEPASMDSGFTKQRLNGTANWSKATQSETGRASFGHVTGNEGEGRLWQDTGTRSKRSVWTIPSEPFPLAHFATFPPALVEPCVQAGTSARGACPACGAPWRREVTLGRVMSTGGSETGARASNMATVSVRGQDPKTGAYNTGKFSAHEHHTLGWAPTCACAPQPVPCVVLDPFAGAGTVGLVAERLGRDAILIDLSPTYAAMAERRIREEAPLLTAVAVEGETVEPPPIEPGGKALTTPRGAEGARWNQNQGRGFARPDGQPWCRAAPPASGNDHGRAAPEQLALL